MRKDGEITLPDNAKVIDAGGKTVIPGRIDAHYHMCCADNGDPFLLNESGSSFRVASHLRRHLTGFVRSVMDAGAYHNVSVTTKSTFEKAHLMGSRPIVVGERIKTTGGHGVSRFDVASEADGRDEFRKPDPAVLLESDLIKFLRLDEIGLGSPRED